MFSGRNLLIATMHGKEKVLQPLLEQRIGVKCVVSPDINTDIFGTFSGEVSRTDSPLETLRKKCLHAMQQTGIDLAVASEGSFGSHPEIAIIPANEEWLMLIDKKNQLEITARVISTATNFNGQYVNSYTELQDFASSVFFPSHALNLRDEKDSLKDIVKGIRDPESLMQHFERMLRLYGRTFAETDMRAMHNPMRMDVIMAAAQKLVEKLHRSCPACGTPGFDIVRMMSGLPCALCSAPTRSAKAAVYGCVKCSFEQEVLYPDDKKTQDPMYCDYCKP